MILIDIEKLLIVMLIDIKKRANEIRLDKNRSRKERRLFFLRTEAITLTSNKVDRTFYALPAVSGVEERMQILAG